MLHSRPRGDRSTSDVAMGNICDGAHAMTGKNSVSKSWSFTKKTHTTTLKKKTQVSSSKSLKQENPPQDNVTVFTESTRSTASSSTASSRRRNCKRREKKSDNSSSFNQFFRKNGVHRNTKGATRLSKSDRVRLQAMNFLYVENLAAARQEKSLQLALDRWRNNERCVPIVVVEPDDDEEDVLDDDNVCVQVQDFFVHQISSLSCSTWGGVSPVEENGEAAPSGVVSSGRLIRNKHKNALILKYAPNFPMIVEEPEL